MSASSSVQTGTRAVIFDLDGVLVWTIPMHWWAFRQTFLEEGKDFSYEDYMERAVGASRDQVIRNVLGDHLPPSRLEQLMASKGRYVEEYVREKGVDTIPGAMDFVRSVRARGLKTAVASASRTPRFLLESVDAAGLFDAIVDRTMVEESKPQPDLFLLCAKMLEVQPSECVVIEDSDVGVEAAVRAGMRVLALTTTHDRSDLGKANSIYRSYADIPLSDWL